MSEKERRAAMLRDANEVREALRLPAARELEQGIPGDSSECALARTVRAGAPELRVLVSEDAIDAWWEDEGAIGVRREPSARTREAIRAFDGGAIEDLVGTPEEA